MFLECLVFAKVECVHVRSSRRHTLALTVLDREMGLPTVHPNQEPVAPQRNRKSNLVVCLIVACLYAAFAYPTRWIRRMPTDPLERAHALLKYTPVCDGHIDLPILVREYFYNQLDKVDLRQAFKGQVDIPRLRRGHTGGFFHSVFVPCNEDMGEGYPRDNGGNFTTPSFRVRDTLEQIDVAKLIIDQYDDVSALAIESPMDCALRVCLAHCVVLIGHHLGLRINSHC